MSQHNPPPPSKKPIPPKAATPLLEALTALEQSFAAALAHTTPWRILPREGNQVLGLFDSKSGLRYPPAKALGEFLATHPFLHLQHADGKATAITLHSKTRLLWFAGKSIHEGKKYVLDEAKALCAEAQWGGIGNWKLPSKDELWTFCTADGNPYR
ncbi:MAG: hypothetical protein ACPLXR_06645, partial [Halothiobacillaceae bacterium]